MEWLSRNPAAELRRRGENRDLTVDDALPDDDHGRHSISQTMNGHHPSSTNAQTGGMNWPQWRLLLLLVAVCFLGHFNRNSIVVAADLRLMDQYGLSEAQMGTVYSAFLLTYTLFMIPGGWLIDRLGAKFSLSVVLFGSAVFIVLTAAVGLATSAVAALTWFLTVRALMGILNAPLHPAAANAVSIGIPFSRRSAANGMVTGAALLGVASSFIVFGQLIDWFSWPVAFLIAAVATAALGAIWLFYGTGEPKDPHRTSPASESRIRAEVPAAAGFEWARIKNLTLLTVSYAAVGYFQYLFFYWMHYYFSEELKLGEGPSRFYATLPPLAMAVGMPLGGWLSDRIYLLFGWRAARAGLAFTAMSTSACLLWVGVRATEPVWIVTWLSLALGVLGMAEGPFWVTAVELGGDRGGLSAGIFNTGGNIGGIVVPVATPLIARFGFGWENAISVASVVCLLGALCWLWIDDGHSDRLEPLTKSHEPEPAPPMGP